MPASIQVVDKALHAIVDPNARIDKVASGFQFTEGPVFSRLGYLLFSDIPTHRILKYTMPIDPRKGILDGELSTFREKANSNGLTFDHQGRLLACEVEVGRVTRTEKDGRITVLAERYQGKGLNNPNDLVYSIDGSIYFTDPIRRGNESNPGKTGFMAVYQITPKGELKIATREMNRPNGIALGPKQLTLYVADSAEKLVKAFDVAGDGSLSRGRVAATLQSDEPGVPDGMKTDEAGNLYVTGPGGLWIFNAQGKHLGTIVTPELPSNCNWGGGFRGLYITARTSVYHVATKIPGTRTY